MQFQPAAPTESNKENPLFIADKPKQSRHLPLKQALPGASPGSAANNVLADQHEYLAARLPRHSRLRLQ